MGSSLSVWTPALTCHRHHLIHLQKYFYHYQQIICFGIYSYCDWLCMGITIMCVIVVTKILDSNIGPHQIFNARRLPLVGWPGQPYNSGQRSSSSLRVDKMGSLVEQCKRGFNRDKYKYHQRRRRHIMLTPSEYSGSQGRLFWTGLKEPTISLDVRPWLPFGVHTHLFWLRDEAWDQRGTWLATAIDWPVCGVCSLIW